MALIRLEAADGTAIAFEDRVIGQGGMKDVYMAADRSHVAAFFRAKPDAASRERLSEIVGRYRERIFGQEGGDYWRGLYCWPVALVEWEGRAGLIVPAYEQHFYFTHGSRDEDRLLGIRGKEKQGKWFASASNRAKFLDPREKGDLRSYLAICLKIARAVRRLHSAGLAHGDLSYRNVLVDPMGGNAAVIDIDGLVVPGKFPPEVVGTPDFIAPEVVATQHLDRADPRRVLPSIRTDRHALAVLIYMYLFFRHPLRGSKVHSVDEACDEALAMGSAALFVEHPADRSNRIRVDQVKPSDLPWADTDRLPCRIAGPLLAPLFESAFVANLHRPNERPAADDWETALVRTVDLLQPCANAGCEMKWFVFDNSRQPACPYCGTPYARKLPVLTLYSSRQAGRFMPDNHRLMVYDGQSLFGWHVNRRIFPNEKLAEAQRRRVGYFQFHDGEWYLVNETLRDMSVQPDGGAIAPGQPLRLTDGLQILFGRDDGARLAVVQMVNG